jgi:protein subunit release factor B
MIQVTRTFTIGEEEIHQEFIRAPGASGQNVNKVATLAHPQFFPTRF